MPIVCRHPKQIGAPCRICAGTTGDIDIFIKEDTMSATFRLYTYDVWGNEKDGYEVNDIFKTSETYEIPAEATDAHVIKALRKQGCFKARVLSRLIGIDGDDETIYVSYKGRPEFELRKGA